MRARTSGVEPVAGAIGPEGVVRLAGTLSAAWSVGGQVEALASVTGSQRT